MRLAIPRLLLALSLAGLCVGPIHAEAVFFGGGKHGLGGTGFSRSYGGVTPAFSDTFSGAGNVSITTRAPDVGSNWAADATSSSAVFKDTGTGRAYADTGGTGNMQVGVTPTDADYTLTGGLYFRTASASAVAALIVRGNTGSGTTLQGYACRWSPTSTTAGNWVIGSYASGTFTLRDGGSDGSDTVTTSVTYAMVCAVSGNTITLTVDGVQQAQWTDPTPLYPSTGRLMARLSVAGSTTTGLQWDYIGYTD